MKLRLFVLLSSIYLLAASREPPWGDAHVVYDTTQNLVEHGRLDVRLGGPTQFYALKDGKKYGVFPLGNVVAMAPSYLVYKVVKRLPGVPDDLAYRWTCHITGSLLVAGVCVLFFVMARREGAGEAAAWWLALGLGTTTILLVYARSPFSEALQTLALTWAVERGLALGERLSARAATAAGIACGLLLNTKLVYALVLPVVALYVLWRRRGDGRKLLVAVGAAASTFVPLVALALWHNHLKTGSLLDSGYRIPEAIFSGDAYAALYGFFFSTGKSIFLYSPLLVLGFLAWPAYFRRERGRALFVLAVVAVVVLTNAKFRHWHADYCWGPRLLVPLVPAMVLPAAPWIEGALVAGRRRLRALGVGALVGAGIYVQVLGAAFYWDHYIRIAIAVKDQTGAGGWYTEDLHHCHFIPQFSPLVGHAWMFGHLARGDMDIHADVPWRRVVPAKVNLTAEWSAVRFDWWVLEAGKRDAVFAVVVLVLLGGAAIWAAWEPLRRLGRRRR